jgi:hypothetical protein
MHTLQHPRTTQLVLVQGGNARWEGGQNRVRMREHGQLVAARPCTRSLAHPLAQTQVLALNGQDIQVECRFDDPGAMQVVPLPREYTWEHGVVPG